MTNFTIHKLGRRPLAMALSALLLSGVMNQRAAAQAFPAVINLSSLNGSNGFRLDGVAAYDYSGHSVSAAGDINHDGHDDLIVGAYGTDPNGSASGSSFLVFGKATPFAPTLALSGLSGTNGFRLNGVAAFDYAGNSVSAAGDVNGDGIGDLIIGALNADSNGGNSGSSYVVFGKATSAAAALSLSSLDGTNGFRIDGTAVNDRSGISVAAAGDVNGDGVDDLIIGAPNADPKGTYSGTSYVVFGKATPFAANLALSSLDGNNGFRIIGAAAYDRSGASVSAAGDINGDGYGDLLIGSVPIFDSDSTSYIVFGKATPFAAALALSSLNGTNGFRLDSVAGDGPSRAVSALGDINGDGRDDLIVGAPNADPNGGNSGSSYVVFGKATPFAATLALPSLNGTNGFRLDGVAPDDRSGYWVSAAGDMNDDGHDDLSVGALNADPNGDSSGSSYVVFGKVTPFSATLALSSLDGTNGFRLDGVAAGDVSGQSVSAAGDINGDGRGDLVIGASRADPNGSNSGSSYVVFGRAPERIFNNGFE